MLARRNRDLLPQKTEPTLGTGQISLGAGRVAGGFPLQRRAALRPLNEPSRQSPFIILPRHDVVGAGRGEQGEPDIEFRSVN